MKKRKRSLIINDEQREFVSLVRKEYNKISNQLQKMRGLTYSDDEISDMKSKFLRAISKSCVDNVKIDKRKVFEESKDMMIKIHQIDSDLALNIISYYNNKTIG